MYFKGRGHFTVYRRGLQRRKLCKDFVVESDFTAHVIVTLHSENSVTQVLYLRRLTVYLYLQLFSVMLHFLNNSVLADETVSVNIQWQQLFHYSLCSFLPLPFHHQYRCLYIFANLFDGVLKTDLNTEEFILLLYMCQMLYEAINQLRRTWTIYKRPSSFLHEP